MQHDRERVSRAGGQDVELPARGRHRDLLGSHTRNIGANTTTAPATLAAGAAGPSGSARASTVYQVLCSHFTLNAVPPVSADAESLARPLPPTMMILVGLALPIAAPFTAALLN